MSYQDEFDEKCIAYSNASQSIFEFVKAAFAGVPSGLGKDRAKQFAARVRILHRDGKITESAKSTLTATISTIGRAHVFRLNYTNMSYSQIRAALSNLDKDGLPKVAPNTALAPPDEFAKARAIAGEEFKAGDALLDLLRKRGIVPKTCTSAREAVVFLSEEVMS